MKGFIFLFVGVILIVVGIVVSQVDMNVSINNRRADAETSHMVQYIVGGGLGALGLIFTLISLLGMMRSSKDNKLRQQIMQNGIPAEGTVTFVDKNWTLLVNHKPIYSIIEYNYKDSNGVQHTRRITNANSDTVIRMQIQVGSKIPIKYSAQNPAESAIVITA